MEMVGASTPVKTQLKAQSVAAIHSTRCTQMGGAVLVSGHRHTGQACPSLPIPNPNPSPDPNLHTNMHPNASPNP